MKKNLMKRLAAATLAGAMVLSMNGMAWATNVGETTAAAESTESVQKVDPTKPEPEKNECVITKIVTVGENTYAPATSFEFTVGEGAEVIDENNVLRAKAGIEGGLTVNTIPFSPTETHTGVSKEYKNYGKLTVNVDKFNNIGVYHYTLEEKNTGYEGVTYSTDKYDIYVTIGYAKSAEGNVDVNQKEVLSITAAKRENSEEVSLVKVKDITFTNDYGQSNGDIYKLTIKKLVDGNFIDRSKEFTFKVKIDGQDNEKYKCTYEGAVDTNPADITSKQDAVNIKLKNNDTVTIHGLSASDKYTVEEALAAGEDYEVTWEKKVTKKDGGEETAKSEEAQLGSLTAETTISIAKETAATGNTNLTITNKKDGGNPATGIITTFAPYILLIAAAGVFAVLFLRKKRNDDEY